MSWRTAVLEKSRKLVEAILTTVSLLGNSGKTLRETRYQRFLLVSKFT